MPLNFVVVSTPRSGTRYMAEVLSACGFPCEHEKVFRYTAYWTEAEYALPKDDRGESSWLAAHWLSELDPSTVILYGMRAPWDTLNSIRQQNHGREIFLHDGQWVPQVLRDLPQEMDDRIVEFWLRWHGMIQASLKRFQHVVRYIIGPVKWLPMGLPKVILALKKTARNVFLPRELVRIIHAIPKNSNTREPAEQRWHAQNTPRAFLDQWHQFQEAA